MKNARTRPRTRHILANTLAGLFLGIGVSLMMTLYGVVGWSTTTPDLIVVFGLVFGLGVGLLPVRTVRESNSSTAKTDESTGYIGPSHPSSVSAPGAR
jgi:hypothetical protein